MVCRAPRVVSFSRRVSVPLALGVLLQSCTQSVEGPTPSLDDEVLPAQACNAANEENANLRTEVTITSQDGSFSPLPVDTLQGEPGIELPRVFLVLDGEETELIDVHFDSPEQLTAIIDADPELAPGIYQFIIENPNGKRSPIAGEIEIVPPPEIERIERADLPGEDAEVCIGTDQLLKIFGTGFRPDDPPPVIEVVRCSDPNDITTCDDVVTTLVNVTVLSETEIEATLEAGSLPPETASYGIRLINPEVPPCTATVPVAISVLTADVTLNTVIPEQGWTGVDTPVQVFGGGFAGSTELRLIGAGPDGSDWELIDEIADGSGTRIDATVPGGGTPGGPYDLILTTDDGCESVLEASFTILPDASLSIDTIIPPFGWTESKTPVTILGADFQSTPRAYLVVPTMEPTLQAFDSTSFVTDSSLNSVVPSGFDVGGPYDLVVINPDGGGGILESAFRVTALAPPTVDLVTPAIGDTQDPTSVTLNGCNFRDPMTVQALPPSGTPIAATNVGTPTCDGSATCDDGSNQCTVSATIPTDTMDVGPYVVRATNTDEDTWGDWSLFVVTLPSGKLDEWQAGAVDLVTGRRQLGGVSGRINNASRFLYAIGGDTGTGGEVLDTVEVIPLDIFGQLGAPFEQRYRLNSPRTQVASFQSGGYIYAVGGSADATGELASVERAKILTFEDQPQLEEATLTTGELGAGAWYYQVAAFYDASHPDNPDGETLPSDEVVVSLGLGGGVALEWAEVPGAAGYRIYRTAEPDGVSSSEVFLAEVDASATNYVDDGSVAVDPDRLPLFRGSTGVWVDVGSDMNHARRGTRVGVAHDPNGDAFAYAVGGWGDCGGGVGEMNCYEFAPLSDDGSTLGAWTDGANATVSPRFQHAMSVGEPSGSDQVPVNEAWVFVTGGLNASSSFEGARVTTGGDLEPWIDLLPPVSASPGARAGHAMQLVANAMFVIGGDAGSDLSGPPLDGSQFSQEFDPVPPDRTSWSNSTAVMNVPRALYALIAESGLFYALGGSTDATLSDATADIEHIVQ